MSVTWDFWQLPQHTGVRFRNMVTNCLSIHSHFILNYATPVVTPKSFALTPLSSSSVEFLCLPLGFFTNSFSQEAWSSFSMLFPALITLEERRERPGGKVRMEVGWLTVFALTAWKHNNNQRDGESQRVMREKKAGQDEVMSLRELAGEIKCFYYELMSVEDNGFRVMQCFTVQQHLTQCVLQQSLL